MFSFLKSLAVPLPTFGISLPANIQRRFLSFVLKYFLGHLVKPGQLDDHKIDAQIGSGRVEINDVELDAEAINTLLAGLPVSLRDGSLGNVSVRVPWPNVLAAPFSVSASGIALTLLLRRTPTAQTSVPANIDLTASVASLVAENFVHTDLSEDEEQELRHSIHPEEPLESSVADAFSMPGSMDPFLGSKLAASINEPGGISDEEGVGVLTAVAERLMARFTCSVRDISLTLIHEGHAAFHLTLGKLSYDNVSDSTIAKSISISGLSLSATVLEPLDSPYRSYSLSPVDSPSRQSSMEEQPASMLQSIVSLADSTMFQSAVSTVRHGSTSPTVSAHPESRTRQIMSISDEPITITLATRPRDLAQPDPSVPIPRQRSPKFTITAAMGYVACALCPFDVGLILRALSHVRPASDTRPGPVLTRPQPKRFSPTFEGSGCIRGIVVVLLLENMRSPTYPRSQMETEMTEFFKNPTRSLSTPHFRMRIDSIEPSLSASGEIQVDVRDFSVFRMQGGPNASAVPILISDLNLDSQYPVNTNAPMFDVVDWTNLNAQAGPPKVSVWRLRAIPGQKLKPATGSQSAIRLRLVQSGDVAVSILPLHFFLGLNTLEDAVMFSYGIGSISPDIIPDGTEPDIEDPITPSTPQFFYEDMEQAGSDRTLSIKCPLVRVQLRTPSPPGKQQRSGAIVIDVHAIEAQLGSAPVQLYWRRLLVALANVGDTKATTILSIGPSRTTNPLLNIFGSTTPTQNNPDSQDSENSRVVIRTGATTTLDIRLPTLHAHLSKFAMDGIQYWADDATQWAERVFNEKRLDNSRDASLIGSRFFARSGSLGTAETVGKASKSQTNVSVALGQAEITLFVPRKSAAQPAESLPFDITASGMQVLLELKPDGKDETRISASVLDAAVVDRNGSPLTSTILKRTHSLNLADQVKPVIKLNVNAIADPEAGPRENRVKVVLAGITFTLAKTYAWADDVAAFFKAPPGTFEAVVPADRLRLDLSLASSCVKVVGPNHPGALVVVANEVQFSLDVFGSSPETVSDVGLRSVAVMLIDTEKPEAEEDSVAASRDRIVTDIETWEGRGFAKLVVIDELKAHATARKDAHPPISVDASSVRIAVLACADTLGVLGSFGADVASMFPKPATVEKPKIHAVQRINTNPGDPRGVLDGVEEHTFRRDPEIGLTPDMIDDDLPTNPEYLDGSFGAAAGVSEFSDDETIVELTDEGKTFESVIVSRATNDQLPDPTHMSASTADTEIPDIDTRGGGETIRMLVDEDIRIVDDYFETVEPTSLLSVGAEAHGKAFSLDIRNCDIRIRLHAGYDWEQTRKAIEQGRKAVRRRLERIRQLLASGQVPDETMEETHTMLFNSIHLGLPEDLEDMEPDAAIAAINRELAEDEGDTATITSWQTFTGQSPRPTHRRQPSKSSNKSRKLTRSRGPRIQINLLGLAASFNQFLPTGPASMRVLATVRDLEILDHIKTSTWNAFLAGMATDFRGNVRETDSNMVRAELCIVRPVQDLSTEEGRLKLKILPIRLHVDQDALDFLKKFFMFKGTEEETTHTNTKQAEDMFFQHVEILPIDLKLDYKPKRVDYRALREGRTIELMNFFHFEGAEMTLRHITLSGINGWARLGDTLNDLWTPDVKATQLAEIVAGIAPFHSLVRVGAGVADLVLLPTSSGWRRDRRRETGVRGAAAEAAALGARLANGAQVILERAESMLGGGVAEEGASGSGSGSGLAGRRSGPGAGAFRGPVTVMGDGEWDGSASVLASATGAGNENDPDDEGSGDEWTISRYAEQPRDVKEGIQSASRALRKNATAAAQTILAIPMEVYEQSENEGPIRAVVRAVPVAVLRPMIGATEAVGQTLWGIRNSLDPAAAIDEGSKWKRR